MASNRLGIVLQIVIVLGVSLGTVGAPSLHISEEVFNFGVVIEGEVVVFAFLLENRGDEVLVIENVEASCGCTTTALSDSEIEPGQIVRLGGEVDTIGAGGTHVSKRVYITTNDPERKTVDLRIAGRVVEEKAFLIDADDLSPGLMIVLDVREYDAYLAGHLAGAISIHAVEKEILLAILPRDVPIVLYDQDGEEALLLAEEMLPLGFTDVGVLLGGLDEWTRRYGQRWVIDLPLTIGVAGP